MRPAGESVPNRCHACTSERPVFGRCCSAKSRELGNALERSVPAREGFKENLDNTLERHGGDISLATISLPAPAGQSRHCFSPRILVCHAIRKTSPVASVLSTFHVVSSESGRVRGVAGFEACLVVFPICANGLLHVGQILHLSHSGHEAAQCLLLASSDAVVKSDRMAGKQVCSCVAFGYRSDMTACIEAAVPDNIAVDFDGPLLLSTRLLRFLRCALRRSASIWSC